MGLKSVIDGLIAGFSDGNDSPASQFRAEQTAMFNNGYVRQADSSVSQTVTTKSGSVITYQLYFWKSHGSINVSGWVYNTGGSNLPNNTLILNFKDLVGVANNEFMPVDGVDFIFDIHHDINDLYKTKLKVSGTAITFPQGASAGLKYDVIFSYPSKY